MIRFWKILSLGVAVLLLQGCAATMLTAPCDHPRVSNSNLPFVYLVMLPYSYRGDDRSGAHAMAARNLTELAGLEAMRMAVETSGMHVTLLEDKAGGCRIEPVYAAFDRKTGLGSRLISSVVFYWGEVFEENDQIVVQSHVRVLWNGRYEGRLHVDVGSPGSDGVLRFTGHMPAGSTSFPPRKLPVGDRAGGSASLKSRLSPRISPSLGAGPASLPEKFQITQRKGDWVELRDMRATGESAGVWVSVASKDDAIKAVLPELSFAHALAAYANYQTVGNPEVARDVRQLLQVFRRGYADAGDPLLRKPIASADVMEGALALARRDNSRAYELLDKAAWALPSDSAVLNLSALAGMPQCCTSREDALRIHDRLELARQLNAGDEEIAKHLLTWYTLVRMKDASVWPLPAEELARRSEALAKILR